MEREDLLETIKQYVDILKQEMEKANYDNEFVKEVVESFEFEFETIMNARAKMVYDLFKNGSRNYWGEYDIRDFGDNEFVYLSYQKVLIAIIKYALSWINDIVNVFEFEMANGIIFRFSFRNDCDIEIPLKELYKEAGIDL